jgi:hypothetical protein
MGLNTANGCHDHAHQHTRAFLEFKAGRCAFSKIILHFEAQETEITVVTVGIELEFELDLQGAVDVKGVLGLQDILYGLLKGLCNRDRASRDNT